MGRCIRAAALAAAGSGLWRSVSPLRRCLMLTVAFLASTVIIVLACITYASQLTATPNEERRLNHPRFVVFMSELQRVATIDT